MHDAPSQRFDPRLDDPPSLFSQQHSISSNALR